MEFNEHAEKIDTYELGQSLTEIADKLDIAPQEVIKLDSNENAYGAPKEAILAINHAMWECSVYPDDSMGILKESLSNHFNILEENLIIGTGRDQVIDMAMRAKCKPGDKILSASTSSVLYKIYAERVGAQMIHTPSDMHKVDEFLETYRQHRPEIVFLSLPNNLLGDCLNRSEVYTLLEAIESNTLVILDGAFQEYAAYKDPEKKIDPSEVIKRHDHVLYLGTFSKVYGLAGMRVGFGIANEETARILMKFRPPYNITTLSLSAAVAALKAQEYVQDCIRYNFEQMALFETYAKKHSLLYLPSYANFLTFPLNIYNSSRVTEGLKKHGVLVFDLKQYNVNAIRVTIGKKWQNEIFFERFTKYMRT